MSDLELRTIPPRWSRRQVSALVDRGIATPHSYLIRVNGSNYEAINLNTKLKTSSTNAQVTFQAVATALSGIGGEVRISKGVYTGNKTPITVNAGVSWLGEGPNGARVGFGTPITKLVNLPFMLQPAVGNTDAGGEFKNLLMYSADNDINFIYSNGIQYVDIKRNVFQGGQNQVTIFGKAHQCHIEHNLFAGGIINLLGGTSAPLNDTPENINIHHNSFSNAVPGQTTDNVKMVDTAAWNIHDNMFENDFAGPKQININGGFNHKIHHNFFNVTSQGPYQIYVESTSGNIWSDMYGIEITNNNFEGNATTSGSKIIALINANSPLVAHNTLHGNSGVPIALYLGADTLNPRVIGNKFFTFKYYAIYCDAVDALISHNVCDGITESNYPAIAVSGDYAIISKNRIKSAPYGIEPSGDYFDASGNIISECLYGLFVEGNYGAIRGGVLTNNTNGIVCNGLYDKLDSIIAPDNITTNIVINANLGDIGKTIATKCLDGTTWIDSPVAGTLVRTPDGTHTYLIGIDDAGAVITTLVS